MEVVIAVDGGVEIKSWLPLKDLEDGAFEQAWNCAKHPAAFSHMALMPDCHQGYGMPIGGVMALKNAISPAMVGVDIGCGMCAIKTNLTVDDFLENELVEIRDEIAEAIPCGEGRFRPEPVPWNGWLGLAPLYKDAVWSSDRIIDTAKKSLGTLGGGNHFIEIQKDALTDEVWIMLHSGSRGFGYNIAQHHMTVADGRDPVGAKLGVSALSMSTEQGQRYCIDMSMALRFAEQNREVMMNDVKRVFLNHFKSVEFSNRVNIHHNYAALEKHFDELVVVHRKGATSAGLGQMGIIPGSMGTMSCIVRGLGNEESFMSCSHGAGRVRGRMDASRSLDLGEVQMSMSGVVFAGFKEIKKGKLKGKPDLGEAPQAYKDIAEVMSNQRDLVDVVHWLEPLAVVKG